MFTMTCSVVADGYDNLVRKYTLALRSLVFVEFEDLYEAFIELKTSEQFPEALEELYTYFYSTYLDFNCRFPPDIWHSQNIVDVNFPRTNNAIEKWHNVFANTFGTSRYSFYLLVSKLKDEEDAIRIRAFLQDELLVSFERKKKYIDRENALVNFLMENRNRNSDLLFIFEVSSILNS